MSDKASIASVSTRRMNQRSRALLAIGVIFLSVPLWAPVLNVTGTDYAYERTDVNVEGDEITIEETGHGTTVAQIACFGSMPDRENRVCRLGRALTRGNVSAPSDIVSLTGSLRPSAPRYVAYGARGQPYRRTVSFNHTTNEYVLGLEPISAERVLEQTADSTVRRPAVRSALETGTGRSGEPFFDDAGRLYETEDGYAIVDLPHRDTFLSAKPIVERGFEAIFVGIGAVVVFRVGRREG